jgi:hydroxypyruvate reductase
LIEGWEKAYAGGLRGEAVSIFQAGLSRADPLRLMSNCLSLEGNVLSLISGETESTWDLARFRRILLIGYGKASARMALGVEALLGDRVTGGIVVTKTGHGERLARSRLLEASHPVPDASSVEAGMGLLALAEEADEETLVINCVSGGGSALLCAPGFGCSLEDKRRVTSLLLASGAPIGAINSVRKHLSLVKGGRLAKALYPATSINLILSDVMGDDLSVIASGPTVPDSATWTDALSALREFGVFSGLNPSLRRTFEEGAAGSLPETAKTGDPAFERCANVLVGTNHLSLVAARTEAERLGYEAILLSTRLEGEARELARVFVAIAADIRAHGLPMKAPACILAGGESTVTLRGKGKGGRNQEMALAFLEAAAGSGLDLAGVTFLSGATDGNDGPTDAAGGIVDASSLEACRASSLDVKAALACNDSYQLLRSAGSLLVTGPTNTNVCDIQVLLVDGPFPGRGPPMH